MTGETCTYCSTLKKGIKGDNFCSVNGVDTPENSKGNSFYLKADALNSGQHISRLAFRGVLSGYQHYKIGRRNFLLNSNNYLMVEKGASYFSEIQSVAPIESVIVAFGDKVDSEVSTVLSKPVGKLLDDPYIEKGSEINLFESTHPTNPAIFNVIQMIKRAIRDNSDNTILFEQLHYTLMSQLIKNQSTISNKLSSMDELKKSTRVELYNRTRFAKDFMEASFSKKLTLRKIADMAHMSPYHFLRSFKKFYKITPLEYLTQTRVKYAQYLLANSTKSIQEVTASCGFENHSSFTRLFKSRTHLHPTNYRSLIQS